MQTVDLIPASEFCVHHDIELSFISSLNEYGLVALEKVEETAFIQINQLPEIEKYVRLHYDLEINLEGLGAITHLLQRIQNMQNEMLSLKNKLRLYEES